MTKSKAQSIARIVGLSLAVLMAVLSLFKTSEQLFCSWWVIFSPVIFLIVATLILTMIEISFHKIRILIDFFRRMKITQK